MEHIRQAVELRRALDPVIEAPQIAPSQDQSNVATERAEHPTTPQFKVNHQKLSLTHLEASRVVAHDVTDLRSKSFDILRTQVLQEMDRKSAKFLAITSATPGCGKTLTSVNLAVSIARQSNRKVLLVDLDLQRPSLSKTLGIRPARGLLSVLSGDCSLADALTEVSIGSLQLTVLPTEAPTQNSSERLTSRVMASLLNQLRASPSHSIVLFDLPPILPSDDVISVLPSMDCALFVATIGTTKKSDIKGCQKYLEMTDVLRIIVNKSDEAVMDYYY
uniref:non-specific protein-tyrosine kinase n=1 Tax=Rhodopseudomonas palustris (strain BisA53) TaxID=316055 RepID=Q07SP3_RHOP5